MGNFPRKYRMTLLPKQSNNKIRLISMAKS